LRGFLFLLVLKEKQGKSIPRVRDSSGLFKTVHMPAPISLKRLPSSMFSGKASCFQRCYEGNFITF
jgi:hypothetical protein